MVFGALFDYRQILALSYAWVFFRRLGGVLLLEHLLYDFKVIVVHDIKIVLHELVEFLLDSLELQPLARWHLAQLCSRFYQCFVGFRWSALLHIIIV